MRLAKRLLNLIRSVSTAENETEISCPLRRRLNLLSYVGRDYNVFYTRHVLRGSQSETFSQDPGARNRNHHHARCQALALDRTCVFSNSIPDDHFFKRHVAVELQRARAQPADCAGSDLDYPRARLIHAQL